MSSIVRPTSLTGGCLCESIRYTINIPEEVAWPLTTDNNVTCQCGMCRRVTGALIAQLVVFPTSAVQPPLESNATFKTYQSSAQACRGFCSNCGSTLSYYSKESPDIIDIHIGSLDPDLLLGKTLGDAEDGKGFKRDGTGIGEQLKAGCHIWVANAIKGVTDHLSGVHYARNLEPKYRLD